MNVPLIPCPCCNGSGKVPLQRDHKRTLDRMKPGKEWKTDDLMEQGVSRGAICNRLARMEAAGLVERIRKESKTIIWRVNPAGKEGA